MTILIDEARTPLIISGPAEDDVTKYRTADAVARVLIARALAQDTPILMADEPIAGLDPAAQIATMQVFARLAAEGHTVIAALHDLGLAARHCTRLVVLARGRKEAEGTPAQVLTPDTLARCFGLRAHFAEGPDGPVFQPLSVLG